MFINPEEVDRSLQDKCSLPNVTCSQSETRVTETRWKIQNIEDKTTLMVHQKAPDTFIYSELTFDLERVSEISHLTSECSQLKSVGVLCVCKYLKPKLDAYISNLK